MKRTVMLTTSIVAMLLCALSLAVAGVKNEKGMMALFTAGVVFSIICLVKDIRALAE